jgi:hypothetical protein
MTSIDEVLARAESRVRAASDMPEDHPDRASTLRMDEDIVRSIRHDIELKEAGITLCQFRDHRNREILDFVVVGFLANYHPLQYVESATGPERSSRGRTPERAISWSANPTRATNSSCGPYSRRSAKATACTTCATAKPAATRSRFCTSTSGPASFPRRRASTTTSSATAEIQNNEKSETHHEGRKTTTPTEYESDRHRTRTQGVHPLRENRNRPIATGIRCTGNREDVRWIREQTHAVPGFPVMRSQRMIAAFHPHELDNDSIPMRRATPQETINVLLRIATWEIVFSAGSDRVALERSIR